MPVVMHRIEKAIQDSSSKVLLLLLLVLMLLLLMLPFVRVSCSA